MEESVEKQLGRLLEGADTRTKTLERIESALNDDRRENGRTRDIVLKQQTQLILLGRLMTIALAGVAALASVKGLEWFGPH